jgi:CDP-diacylglycerol--serine O-phosphatidyltransferase
MLFSLVAIGLLMVSTFRYRSFKQIDLRRRWSYREILPVAAVILVAALNHKAFFLAVAVVYTLSAPLGWVWGRLRSRGASPSDEAAVGAGDPGGGPGGEGR